MSEELMLVHDRTKEHVAQFITRPSHALLLVGQQGIGKTFIAEHIISHALNVTAGKLADYPYLKVVSPEKGTISIEKVRELQHFLQLKTLGKGNLRRAVVIEHANGLTIEAQNAFLKLLEEPPADTLMVLTADNPRALLPTIRSRVQSISVYAPETAAVQAFFAGKYDKTLVTQAYFLSGGLPGLMHALLSDEKGHPLFAAVTQAKGILQKSTFERLTMIEAISKQREEARYVLEALALIAQTGLSQATQKADPAKIKQWHHVLKESQNGVQALLQNGNTKLVLDNVMLHL